jgi:hypothetical protein
VRHPAAGELRLDGMVGEMTVSVFISMAARPTRNTLSVFTAKGSAEVDFFHGFALIESAHAARAYKIARPLARGGRLAVLAAANLVRRAVRSEPAYPGLRSLVAATHAAVRSNSSAPIAPAETLAVAAMRDLAACQMATTP